jgi:eukaryotic-like serine/threonine-protein kinase
MASVWLAERNDGAHGRQVALKLPAASVPGTSPTARSRVIAQRFERERAILSSLRHPHIAQVLDAGADDGQPWLAMELVDGTSITHHCAAQQLNVRQVLTLFLPVLRAVQHAHAQLVIHRDIKPANVMVDHTGAPKLLDFGVAKLLEAEHTDTSETALTALGGRAFTPQYASPEQVAGVALGTASDVYSLGVLLYELLTGQLPYRLKRGSAAELEEAILTAQVRRPSQAADKHRYANALRGDVDTIVMKALQAPPTQRYASAESFAQDIERHLAHLPVTARADSWQYRLHKLWQRQRVVMVACAAVLTTMALGLGAALWQSHQRAQQVQLAKESLQDTETALAFVSMVLTEGIKADEAVTLDELLKRSEMLTQVNVKSDPSAYLVAVSNLASIHSSLGQQGRVVALITRALTLVPAGTLPEKSAYLSCMRANSQADLGKATEARQTLDAVIAALPSLTREAGWYCLSRRAILRRALNDGTGALADIQQALALFDRYGPVSPTTRASLLGEQAYAMGLLGEHAKAHAGYQEALALLGRVGRDQTALAATIVNNWGVALIGAGRPRDALSKFDQASAIGRMRSPDQQPPLYARLNRANAMRASGDYDAAMRAYADALPAARHAGSLPATAAGLAGLVGSAANAGRLQEVTAPLDEMTTLLTAGRVPPDGPPGLNLRLVRALIYQSQNQWQEADAELLAVQAKRQALALKGATDIFLWVARSDGARAQGRHAEALTMAQQALHLAAASRGGFQHTMNGGLAWLAVAQAQAAAGQTNAVQTSAKNALTELQACAAPQHPKLLLAQQLAK